MIWRLTRHCQNKKIFFFLYTNIVMSIINVIFYILIPKGTSKYQISLRLAFYDDGSDKSSVPTASSQLCKHLRWRLIESLEYREGCNFYLARFPTIRYILLFSHQKDADICENCRMLTASISHNPFRLSNSFFVRSVLAKNSLI